MIQITPQMKILLAIEPVDFRKGIDGLAAVCRSRFKHDPFSGIMFVFRNRKKTSFKILFYDSQGFWLFHKRLSKGRLSWWPNKDNRIEEPATIELAVYQLQWLLWNGDIRKLSHPVIWKPLL